MEAENQKLEQSCWGTWIPATLDVQQRYQQPQDKRDKYNWP